MQPIRLQAGPILVAALAVFLIFDLLPHPALGRGIVLTAVAELQATVRERGQRS